MKFNRWVECLALAVVVFAFAQITRTSKGSLEVRPAYSDSYQLAIASWTVSSVLVSTSVWTQVDTPQLVGRTSLTIYDMDTSSPVYCRQDNSVLIANARNDTTQSTGTIAVQPAGATLTTSGPNYVTFSLSNFSSSRGAYPVSSSMPVYCVSARPGTSGIAASTVTVMQSF